MKFGKLLSLDKFIEYTAQGLAIEMWYLVLTVFQYGGSVKLMELSNVDITWAALEVVKLYLLGLGVEIFQRLRTGR